jgi:hypothetical protein
MIYYVFKQMGFNKRFLKKEGIINNVHNIIRYLNVDAIFTTDDFSKNVFDLYTQGKSEEEIIKYINENKNEN